VQVARLHAANRTLQEVVGVGEGKHFTKEEIDRLPAGMVVFHGCTDGSIFGNSKTQSDVESAIYIVNCQTHLPWNPDGMFSITSATWVT